MNKLTSATQLLDQLIALDKSVCSAQYEMGQILSAIEHGSLWDDLGYSSMKGMIEEELSVSSNTASGWMHTYREFKRLHYTKTEALGLIGDHSYTTVSDVLPAIRQKASSRVVGKRIADRDWVQVNFSLTKAQKATLYEWLTWYGAEEGATGRLNGASDALMAILNDSVLDIAA